LKNNNFRKIDLSSVCEKPQKKEEKAIKEKWDQKRKDLHEKVRFFFSFYFLIKLLFCLI